MIEIIIQKLADRMDEKRGGGQCLKNSLQRWYIERGQVKNLWETQANLLDQSRFSPSQFFAPAKTFFGGNNPVFQISLMESPVLHKISFSRRRKNSSGFSGEKKALIFL